MKCSFCGEDAIYRCSACGEVVCGKHSKLHVVCPSCFDRGSIKMKIDRATSEEDKAQIRRLVKGFWGEEEQLTFDRKLNVADLPAYVTHDKGSVVGFVSFAEANNAVIIVALGVLPQHQNAGVGRRLLGKVEEDARKVGKERLLVSTSNDDLPALGFYQALGFQIFEVRPNVIAEKHRATVAGIGGLPVRDEIRLQKALQ